MANVTRPKRPCGIAEVRPRKEPRAVLLALEACSDLLPVLPSVRAVYELLIDRVMCVTYPLDWNQNRQSGATVPNPATLSACSHLEMNLHPLQPITPSFFRVYVTVSEAQVQCLTVSSEKRAGPS